MFVYIVDDESEKGEEEEDHDGQEDDDEEEEEGEVGLVLDEDSNDETQDEVFETRCQCYKHR